MDDPDAGNVDYETPDGSVFSLRAVWKTENGASVFQFTTISAQVDGQAYTGKLAQKPNAVDDADVLSALEPVPPGCVYPKFPEGFTEFKIEEEEDLSQWYFKAPSYTYDDCQPGRTFVADCVLNEVIVLDRLDEHPHRNLPFYVGCLVKDGYITHICFERYSYSLKEAAVLGLSAEQVDKIVVDLDSVIKHLHALGLAHNDVNVDNVCMMRRSDAPVLIDFDGCLPFGEKLLKGVDVNAESDAATPVSRPENDFHGLRLIDRFLREECSHGTNVGRVRLDGGHIVPSDRDSVSTLDENTKATERGEHSGRERRESI